MLSLFPQCLSHLLLSDLAMLLRYVHQNRTLVLFPLRERCVGAAVFAYVVGKVDSIGAAGMHFPLGDS